MNKKSITYGEALFEAMDYLLYKYPEFLIMGQGLWSPWYVGDTMTGLEKKYGKERIIDTPVSENGTTGAAMGAALTGLRPLVVHPRMDFMILASDTIVNQTAKWQSMLGGGKKIPLTIRAIINRGGEQGAQHSQALHSWYAHIPGLRVVMPYDPLDARDLLIASVLIDDPVIFIDDRWCYKNSVPYKKINVSSLKRIGPKQINFGEDLTLVGAGYSTNICKDVCKILEKENLKADIFDMRIINPIDITPIISSVENTQKLFVIDGGWQTCGLGGEIIASVIEKTKAKSIICKRFSTENVPAPSSRVLEKSFYQNPKSISKKIIEYFS